MKRWNWNVLALKRAKEGYAPPYSPDIDLIYPAFHKPSSQDARNDPNRRSEVESSSQDSPAAAELTLNYLEKVKASISSQKVVDWMIDPVGTETANWVDHRTALQQLFHWRTRSVRSVLEADAKEFSDPYLQEMVESYRKKLLDEFMDRLFNSERNNWEEINANANKRGPDGWVKLELKEGSKPAAFSIIRAVGLLQDALKKKVQGFEKRGWIEKSKSPWLARGFLVPKPGVNNRRLVIDHRYLNSCLEEHEFPLPVIEDLLQRQHENNLGTVLDLDDGFHQMPLTEKSCPLTALCTPWGVYQWNVLRMGVKVGPQVYQRMVTHCIRHLPPSVRAYIDDLLVGTPPSKASRGKGKLLDSCALDEEAITEHYGLIRKFFDASLTTISK